VTRLKLVILLGWSQGGVPKQQDHLQRSLDFIDVPVSKCNHSLMEMSPFLRRRQLCSYSRTSQHFMEPEGSLSCSQEPSSGPYTEPDQSNPYHHILFKYCTLTYALVFLVVSFLLAFPPISYMHSSSPQFVLHALPISSSLI
jgi:hypothetical protein